MCQERANESGSLKLASSASWRTTERMFSRCSQSEIAEQIGVSQMQISRILRGAITTLCELTVAEIPVAGDEGSA